MIRIARPAVDPRIISAFGKTRDGQPLSYNRAPSADLTRWIARLSVTKFDLPPEQVLACGLFADSAGIRIQLAGEVSVETRAGQAHYGRSALFCGPQSRLMPVRIRGSFISIGVSIRPSACAVLMGPQYYNTVDQVGPTEPESWDHLLSLFPPDGTAEEWLCLLEDTVRQRIGDLHGAEPEPITAAFEEIAFFDPAMSIAQAAREIGVDRRRLERLVNRDFSMPPKQVLRRARALDMASLLRGVADDDEAEALALRYYDESHLIREFIELFGMSPRQFTALPQPLLTLNLEVRQARRLEMVKRLVPGEPKPWE